jgi:hypothetical protein
MGAARHANRSPSPRRPTRPGWVIVEWDVGLAMHAISVLRPRATITEEELRREVDRLKGGR